MVAPQDSDAYGDTLLCFRVRLVQRIGAAPHESQARIERRFRGLESAGTRTREGRDVRCLLEGARAMSISERWAGHEDEDRDGECHRGIVRRIARESAERRAGKRLDEE